MKSMQRAMKYKQALRDISFCCSTIYDSFNIYGLDGESSKHGT